MVHRRCLQEDQLLAIAVVEVEQLQDRPCLEDPLRSTAVEQLVIRLPQQVESQEPLLACLRSHHFLY